MLVYRGCMNNLNDLFGSIFKESHNGMDQATAIPQRSNIKGKKSKTKTSNPNINILNSFGESTKVSESVYRSLVKKASNSEIDLNVLGEVYIRGLNAWFESSNISREQYAFARVNSYINQGKTYFNEDADLHEEESVGTIERKKIEAVQRSGDRKENVGRPNSKNTLTRQTEIQRKIIESFTNAFASKPKDREQGTTSLRDIYRKETPGQEKIIEVGYIDSTPTISVQTKRADRTAETVHTRTATGQSKTYIRKQRPSKDIVPNRTSPEKEGSV